MTEEPEKPQPTTIQELAAMIGLPEMEPFTEEERRHFREKMERANAQARVIYGLDQERPAA